MKYLRLFENYGNNYEVESWAKQLFDEPWNNPLSNREESIITTHILKGKERIESFTGVKFESYLRIVTDLNKELSYAKDDGYYYLQIKAFRHFGGDISSYGKHYFRFETLKDILFYLDAVISSKKYDSNIENIIDIYNIKDYDTYFNSMKYYRNFGAD